MKDILTPLQFLILSAFKNKRKLCTREIRLWTINHKYNPSSAAFNNLMYKLKEKGHITNDPNYSRGESIYTITDKGNSAIQRTKLFFISFCSQF